MKLGIRRSSPRAAFSQLARGSFSQRADRGRSWETEMGGISSERLQIFFKANIFLKNKLFLNCEDDFLHFLAALLKSLLLQMSSSLRRGKYQPSSWIISSFKSPPLSFASRQHSQLLCKSLLRKNIKQLANNIPSEDAAWINQSICFNSNSNT